MALDPRTRLLKTLLQGNANTEATGPSLSKPRIGEPEEQGTMTAKRRKLNALTEALLDPFTTTREGELTSLMLAAKRRSIDRTTPPSK